MFESMCDSVKHQPFTSLFTVCHNVISDNYDPRILSERASFGAVHPLTI